MKAKPFLKWAGGKRQLLEDISKRLPKQIIRNGVIDNYVEPFVGGGAVFFYLKREFIVKKAFLSDINEELILSYKVIQKKPKKLFVKLKKLERRFLRKSNKRRKKYYYYIRDKIFNAQKKHFNFKTFNRKWIDRAAQLIFLNKTCYNGLFRLNSKGEFNVPYGRNKNPKISDEMNIWEVSKALQNTIIYCSDFEDSEENIDENSFVYLDPPYRPLNNTAYFTQYSKDGFNDKEQKRLIEFFIRINKKGADIMFSNSDPKNENPNDNSFEDLFAHLNVGRVSANRLISCNHTKRSGIMELIVTNYKMDIE